MRHTVSIVQDGPDDVEPSWRGTLMELSKGQLVDRLGAIPRRADRFAIEAVDCLLAEAQTQRVSDVHLVPQQGKSLLMLWRIDGVLHPVYEFTEFAANVVARLKVLADLLTYRTDVPQEGRIRSGTEDLELRVSTFPTIHGEKAVVRLFVASGDFRYLSDLGLADGIQESLEQVLTRTAGVLVLAGPAGAGKTTTLYACLRTMLRDSPHLRSIATLEDPV
ncbi:MAG: Flp pilus assembly complex ATPase component TadA, partial [Planctomycetaceae bacterium]|nr:Flp pilus assembly complex ATPase component TadA [Planctomycetaceae bacterium]